MNNIFKFRKYKVAQGKKRVKHPKLIVDENSDEFGFMGLTSSKTKGRGHKNIALIKNPQKGNNKKAYLRRKIEYDLKTKFSEILKDYQLSPEDIEFIIKYVNDHKKEK